MKIGLTLDENLQKNMLVLSGLFFRIRFFASGLSSVESKLRIKPQMGSFRKNLESIIGYDVSEQLAHFKETIEEGGFAAFEIEGCISFLKITDFKLKPRVLFFVNQR